MLRLTMRRFETRSAMWIAIDDGNRYVENFFTDEMACDAFDLHAAKRAFMDDLCDAWFRLYGEHIEAISEEGAEWIVRYKNDGIQVSSEQESGQSPDLDSVPSTETISNVVRD